MTKKRAAVFVLYDKDGIVDSYIIYLLQELLSVCEKLVVVCNGLLSDDGRTRLEELTSDIIVRDNEGFDAWAYKTGMEYIGWDNLKDYDELVLLNDTVFGPFYPFSDIFNEMKAKGVDFWGISKHGRFANPDGLTKGGLFPEHIQTYFIVIGRKMLADLAFRKYWENLQLLKSWNATVSYFESQFTKHFEDLGFSWDVYSNADKELADYYDVSLMSLMPYEIVKDYKCPFIKRKNFTIEYSSSLTFAVGNSTKRAYDYICENTEYDVDLIWEHILRTGNLRSIKDNMHLNYVLSEKNVEDESIDISKAKVAVFAHITYDDLVDFCADYICSASEIADVYVTTTSEKTGACIIDRLGQEKLKKLEVIVLPAGSKGRDVAALWVALKPYMESYDYICFIHNKKSPQVRPLTVGREFGRRCMDNTLVSKEYVINIVGLFEKTPRLGMLFPPPVIHGPYIQLLSFLWTGNYHNTVALAKRIGANVPIDHGFDPIFPTGGMFWFRTKALKKIIDYDWKYDDFPDEPLPEDGTIGHAFERVYCFAAQSEGFYSAWVMNEFFSKNELTSMSYILSCSKPSLYAIMRRNLVDRLRRHPGMFKFLQRHYRKIKQSLKRLRGR